MTPALANPLSALHVQGKRFAASAHNVAAAGMVMPFSEADQAAGPLRVDAVSVSGGGVRGQTRFLAPPYLPSWDPDHPLADGSGYTGRFSAGYETETVRQIEAQRSYEANLAVLRTGDRMLGALLDVAT